MTTENRIDYDGNGDARSFVGPEAVNVFAMAALACGLELYARCGMRPNRSWTPAAMMRAARHHTGKTFKARDYNGAAAALRELVESEKARIASLQSEPRRCPHTEHDLSEGRPCFRRCILDAGHPAERRHEYGSWCLR